MYEQNDRHSALQRIATELYVGKRSYLLAIARRNAVDEADAEEALQETFTSFLRRFDPTGEGPALAWITLALKRQCWRQRRDARLDRWLGQETQGGEEFGGFVLERLPSRAPSLEESLIERDEARRRLGRLKPDERLAVLLRGAGFSYREIGEARGWTYTKTNRCVSEGRATLRKGVAP